MKISFISNFIGVIVFSFFVSGCATSSEIIASNEVGVIVKAPSMKEAMTEAEAQCLKHGRHARADGFSDEPFGKIMLRASCIR